MATWINHVTVAAPRNGTTSHTVGPDGTGGTVVGGTAFTPTAGRYLLAVVEGAVTSSTPAGYALGTSAINNTGLYAFYRASASGTTADRITTTHNGSNYPIIIDFYEFPAGTTWTNGIGRTGISPTGGSTATLSSLTGTYWAGYASAYGVGVGATAGTYAWSAPAAERTDTGTPASGTDGYMFSAADQADATGSSTSATFTTSGSSGTSAGEALTLAQTVATTGAATVTGAASLTAQSSLTATAGTKGNVAAGAALTGQSAQTAAARADVPGSAALAGGSDLTAAGQAGSTSSAALAGASTLTAAGAVDVRAAATLAGTSSTTAASAAEVAGTAGFTATGGLAASATTSTPSAPQVFAAATLAATSDTAAAGHVDTHATAALTAAGQLTAGATLHHYGTATLTGTGTLGARWTSGQVSDITLTIGPPTHAWATTTPGRAWAAGPPTL